MSTHVWALTLATPTDGTYVPFINVATREEGFRVIVRGAGTKDGHQSAINLTKDQMRELLKAIAPFLESP